MKKILYFTTLTFNAIGGLCTLSLFFYGISFLLNYLPIIVLSLMLFVISFTVTILEFSNKSQNHISNMKHLYLNKKEFAIKNYKDYFKSQKYDFMIS